ncbi:MAG: hypothetical protein JOY92_15650 [Verrucomicrobia bacterium]|nr:hypothetical protein [Verrucomicrobiota bacterium]
MKGTIYLYVLIAVVAGALVSILGILVQQALQLPSSIMEPALIGAVAAVISVLIVRGLLKR